MNMTTGKTIAVVMALVLVIGQTSRSWAEEDAVPKFIKSEEVETLEIQYRSPLGACLLSFGSTVALLVPGIWVQYEGGDHKGIGTGLILLGLTIGPSIGHMYTGNWGKVAAFTGGRLAFLGLGVVGAGVSYGKAFSGDSSNGSEGVALLVGAAGLLALTIIEPIVTYQSAVDFNEAQRKGLTLSPLVIPPPPGATGSAAPGFGLGLSGRF